MKCQTRCNRTKDEPSKTAEQNEDDSSEDIIDVFVIEMILVLLMFSGLFVLIRVAPTFLHSFFHIPLIGQ